MNLNKINEFRTRLNHPKRIAIIGAERSGMAAACVCKTLDIPCFVSDSGKEKSQIVNQLQNLNIDYEFNQHSEKIFQNTDLIIVSPGVPKTANVLKEATIKKIPVWSEIELAYRLWQGKLIGITGSVGKSSITTWIGSVLNEAAVPNVVCGNIGKPFSDFVIDETIGKWAILEVSSFQLEWIVNFAPDIAILTNLLPNHLDRYASVDEYYSTKLAITQNQKTNNYLITNYDDKLVEKYFKSYQRNRFQFSSMHPLEKGVWIGHDRIMIRDTEELPTKLTKLSDLQVIGRHNYTNACVVAAASYLAGVSFDQIRSGLTMFSGLPHRLQKIPTNDGKIWYNDSKATTTESAKVALLSFNKPVIWLAGGYNKGMDLSVLKKLAQKKVKQLITFGASADVIESSYSNDTITRKTSTLKQAVSLANQISTQGDVILLSPMCASFDEFRDFEERGEQFIKYVRELQC